MAAVCGGLKVVMKNWAEVAFAAICGGIFSLMGKVCITLSGPAAAYQFLTSMPTNLTGLPIKDMTEPLAFVLALVIFSQFFANTFCSIFSLVIDTILFCYIIDKKEHGTSEKPK